MFGISSGTVLQTVAIVVMGLGLIGSVLPFMPGGALIFAGALLWSWADGFAHVGAFLLVVLAVIAVGAEASDWVLSSMSARKAGATWKTIAGALIGGLIGGGLGTGVIPVVGSMLGAAIGAVLGVVILEYAQRKDWAVAWATARSYCLGSLIAVGANLTLCLLMIAIFAIAARTR